MRSRLTAPIPAPVVERVNGKTVWRFPMKLPSLANARLHWRAMDKLKKEQKAIVGYILRLAPKPWMTWQDPPGSTRITLTRIAPRPLDGHDNLRGAFKYVVDTIADRFDLSKDPEKPRLAGQRANDSDPRVEWVYRQERGAVREEACRIEVERIIEAEEEPCAFK